jgi:hypothetical protein
MTLTDWVATKGLSYGAAAKLLGLASRATAWRYCRGDNIPRPDVMQRILERTSGAVTPADFYVGRVPGRREKEARSP